MSCVILIFPRGIQDFPHALEQGGVLSSPLCGSIVLFLPGPRASLMATEGVIPALSDHVP